MQAVTIEQFPGLDLRADPGDSPSAIGLFNVTLAPGRVRTRYGSTVQFTAAQSPTYLAPGVGSLIVGCPAANIVFAYSAAGALLASSVVAGTTSAGVNIGTTAGSFFYYATDGGTNRVRRFDGAAWTTPAAFAATPGIRALAVTPNDNRMMLCYAPSTVRFSDPGLPETYTANNYVLLDPGDGEEICGAVTFNNQVFVFKSTKFYVFYGQSTDATGSPIFNYRSVKTGVGMAFVDPQSVCVGRDGVYFVAVDGIYRTTGGSPECISRPLDPLFLRTPTPYLVTPFAAFSNSGSLRMAWANDVLYVSDGAGPIVYDPRLEQWSLWGTVNIGAMTSFRFIVGGSIVSPESSLVIADRDLKTVRYMDPAATADTGADTPAITSSYRSAFSSFGTPGMKRLRQTILEGTGTPTLQWSMDWGALATGSAVALGAGPTPDGGRQRIASRGQAFSFQLGATSGAWSINSMQAILHPQTRPPGITVQP